MVRQGSLLISIVIATLFAAPVSAQGDRLIIDNVNQREVADSARPNRGMSMETVEAQWGAPLTKRNAIGDPPITRWEYQAFVVYFEYSNVIHAVNTNP